MSGVKNIANAIMNDPGFSSKAGMSKQEAAEFVSGSAGGKSAMQHKAGKAITKPGK